LCIFPFNYLVSPESPAESVLKYPDRMDKMQKIITRGSDDENDLKYSCPDLKKRGNNEKSRKFFGRIYRTECD
jgi:hypothetical protein